MKVDIMRKGERYLDKNNDEWKVIQVLPDRECIIKKIGSKDFKTASIKYLEKMFTKDNK